MSGLPNKVIADPATHYGNGRAATRSFMLQRITGAINVLLTLFLLWFVVRLAGAERAAMVETVRSPLVWLPLIVLVVNVPIHMRIGMNEVIEDYVHEPRLTRFSMMANSYIALVAGLIGVLAILKIAIWG